MLDKAVNTTVLKREFSVADEYQFNRSGPLRWIFPTSCAIPIS